MSERPSHALDAFLAATPACADAALDVAVERPASCLNLRGKPADLEGPVAELAGASLPVVANRFERGAANVYWLGPEEWLVTAGTALDAADWRRRLQGAGGSVVDLSAGYVSLQVNGPRVRDLFAKGCTLDLHGKAFKPGDCAQTGMAKCAVLIARESGEHAFRLIVRRSFAEYLALWLRRAGEEFGIGFRNIG